MSKTWPHIDILIRILHIIIMLGFIGAYFTGDNEDLHQVHMMFGYVLLISITARVIWHFLVHVFQVQHRSVLKSEVT